MLEAEIEDDAFLSCAWADSQWNGNAGHDLQSAIQIVRPPNPGTYIQILGPLRLVWGHNTFT